MSDPFPVKVRHHSSQQVEIYINPSTRISELKMLIEQSFAIPPCRQRLISQGKLLNDSDTATEAKLQPGFVIQLLISSPVPPPPLPVEERDLEEARPMSP